MKKLIAFMLIAALIFCFVGCTPEVPEVTDPSGTQPTETDPTGTDQTDGTEDPTDSDEPEVLEYQWEEIAGWLDIDEGGSGGYDEDGNILPKAFIFASYDALQKSVYPEGPLVEDYDEGFFETNTLIVVNCIRSSPVSHRVKELTLNEDGTLVLTVERLTPELFHAVSFGTTLLIELHTVISEDTPIEISVVETIVTGEDILNLKS